MQTLSLAMIVRNEELLLGRLLACARPFVDQIVVVDTGSSDRTEAIARDAGAEVHHFTWVDDFAAARNAAFSLCSGDWILWLDADDFLPAAAQQAFQALKSGLLESADIDGVMIPYVLSFDDHGQPVEQCDRERVIRRAAHLRWSGRVHETLALPAGRVGHCRDAWVEHRPDAALRGNKAGRNLRIYRQFVDIDRDEPHVVFQFACELQWNALPAEAVTAFRRFLGRVDGEPDAVGDQYLACIKLADCAAGLGQVDEAVAGCLKAVGLDCRRAEAFTLAGEILLRAGRNKEAWPFLAVASALPLPAPAGKLVFPWFYGQRARDGLARCLPAMAPHGGLPLQMCCTLTQPPP